MTPTESPMDLIRRINQDNEIIATLELTTGAFDTNDFEEVVVLVKRGDTVVIHDGEEGVSFTKSQALAIAYWLIATLREGKL